MNRSINQILFVMITASLMASCSSSSSTSTGMSAGALSSPLARTSSSAVLAGSRIFASTYSDRATTIANLVAATSPDSCTFTIDITASASRAACYGPKLQLGGTHPDSSAATAADLPTGDLGIWNSTQSGEACTAAQFTRLMDYHTKYAYFAQLTAAALRCFATTSGLTLPAAVGDPAITLTTDQLSDFSFTSGSDTFTATSATITGITDTAGDFGLKFQVAGTVVANSVSYPFSVKVYFVDEADGGFTAKAAYYFRETAGSETNCSATTLSGTTRAGTMIYTRADSASNVKIMLNQGTYCGTDYNPFDVNDSVNVCDFAANAAVSSSTDSGNGWGGNWNYLNFEFDPTTLIGSYAYSWIAGQPDTNIRTFNVKLSSATDGVGYFGFGPYVGDTNDGSCTSRHADIGKITKMICNWTGPSNSHTGVSYVQKQVISKASGVWTVSSENIKYNPVNDCTNRGSLTFYSHADASVTHLNYTNDSDVNTSGGSSNDLDTLANYQAAFTRPSEPSF